MGSTLYANLASGFYERALYENADGSVMNIEGKTSDIKVAKFYGTDPVLTIPGAIDGLSTGGIFYYQCDPAAIQSLGYGTYFYTRYLYRVDSSVESAVSGTLNILPGVV